MGPQNLLPYRGIGSADGQNRTCSVQHKSDEDLGPYGPHPSFRMVVPRSCPSPVDRLAVVRFQDLAGGGCFLRGWRREIDVDGSLEVRAQAGSRDNETDSGPKLVPQTPTKIGTWTLLSYSSRQGGFSDSDCTKIETYLQCIVIISG